MNNDIKLNDNKVSVDRIALIENFTEQLTAMADGESIIGDGENLVYETKDVKIEHNFVDGIYIRRMNMNKNSMVIGAIHNHLHVWFLLKGHVTIANKEGVEDYEAPCQVISTPGTRRIIQANKDSIFVNVHKNPDNLDIDRLNELEKQFCSMNMEEYKNRKI
tara:strand:- start:2979 stop:3464 length:486 start_codon:yes stop_codon:yes gene_type:complete